ncbi:hypothetical protein F511_30303 [Dorcoceras hygrometricum]|uniref:Uncharacterized protein n=1 Tax=Dorcoceras hygrometricum TaxID=472368 RepID=A0A2Z7CIU6_9LAMI|nr:hypothetical protein F511_30303 [Dorcoceras hygrometricum]
MTLVAPQTHDIVVIMVGGVDTQLPYQARIAQHTTYFCFPMIAVLSVLHIGVRPLPYEAALVVLVNITGRPDGSAIPGGASASGVS